jgi:hypothetical protein
VLRGDADLLARQVEDGAGVDDEPGHRLPRRPWLVDDSRRRWSITKRLSTESEGRVFPPFHTLL